VSGIRHVENVPPHFVTGSYDEPNTGRGSSQQSSGYFLVSIGRASQAYDASNRGAGLGPLLSSRYDEAVNG
jgi:hypothetical protein